MENIMFSGIKITEVRIRNFRSLENVNVKLDDFTVIVGENNSGKSNFIDALSFAMGFNRPRFGENDIYITKDENKIDKKIEVLIDLLIRPSDTDGNNVSEFHKESFWIGLWGSGINIDLNNCEFVGIRTKIAWDSGEGDYKVQRKFLKEWVDNPAKILEARTGSNLNWEMIEPISFYAMDANRDISNDFKNSNTPWKRMTSNLQLSESKVKEFEEMFQKFNENLTDSSVVLSTIQKEFDDLSTLLNSKQGSVLVKGIPQNIYDLSKRIELDFATRDARSFPLEYHSSGTRSISSVLLFKIFLLLQKNSKKNYAFHTFFAIEEPESHLHPHAASSFLDYIRNMDGQRIITTHSPSLVRECDLFSLRRFIKTGEKTEVVQLNGADLSNKDDKQIIMRKVLKTNGEILFSKALILFEGEETEDQAFPIYARKYWGKHHSALGISMVSVNGQNYGPFIKLARTFKIPWFIFSDGEEKTRANLQSILKENDYDITCSNVFIIPEGKNYEQYIASEEYRDVLIEVIISNKGKNEKHKKSLETKWKSATLEDISKELKNCKRTCAEPVAEAIINVGIKELQLPALIKELFKKVSDDLNLEYGGTFSNES